VRDGRLWLRDLTALRHMADYHAQPMRIRPLI
jgi:hypothetical protein